MRVHVELLLILAGLGGCARAPDPEPAVPTRPETFLLGDVRVRFVRDLPPGPEPESVPWFPSEDDDPALHATCDCQGERLRVFASPGGYVQAALAIELCREAGRWVPRELRLAHLRDDKLPPEFGVARGTLDVLQPPDGALVLAFDLRSGAVGLRGRVEIEPDACGDDLDLWFGWGGFASAVR
jgi:hypothetical protein